jgi:hypothetical protein
MYRQNLRNGDVVVGTVKYADIPQKMFVKTNGKNAEILAEKLNAEGVRFSAVFHQNGTATVTVNADIIQYTENLMRKIDPSFQPKYTAEKPTFVDILGRFQNVQQVHGNQYIANCPCCLDTKQHLYIKENVVIITDYDKPGVKYGRDIAGSLHGENGEKIAKQGVIISSHSLLPTLREKGDISDIVAEKGEEFARQAIMERVGKYFPKEMSTVSISCLSQVREYREFVPKDKEIIQKEENSVEEKEEVRG